jgi:hypothetical protein
MMRSYALMLDFYGMKLKDQETGELERSENYVSRYRNLNTSGHNYLRITRILKSLGELGFEHLKFPFLAFVADEIWTNGQLKNCKSSIENYWTGTLRDDAQRAEMEQRISAFKKAAGEDDEDRYSRYSQQRYGGGRGAGGSSAGGRGAPARRPVYADSDSGSDNDEDEGEDDTQGDDDAQANKANPPAKAKVSRSAVAGEAQAAPVANANANANSSANPKEQEATTSSGSSSDDEGEEEPTSNN